MKIIKVKNCKECPHPKHIFGYSGVYCCHDNVIDELKNENEIPEWCPLEDYKGEK